MFKILNLLDFKETNILWKIMKEKASNDSLLLLFHLLCELLFHNQIKNIAYAHRAVELSTTHNYVYVEAAARIF